MTTLRRIWWLKSRILTLGTWTTRSTAKTLLPSRNMDWEPVQRKTWENPWFKRTIPLTLWPKQKRNSMRWVSRVCCHFTGWALRRTNLWLIQWLCPCWGKVQWIRFLTVLRPLSRLNKMSRVATSACTELVRRERKRSRRLVKCRLHTRDCLWVRRKDQIRRWQIMDKFQEATTSLPWNHPPKDKTSLQERIFKW